LTIDEEAKSYLTKGISLTKLKIAQEGWDTHKYSNRTKKEETEWLSQHTEVKEYHDNGSLHKHYWTLLNGNKDGEFKLYEEDYPDTLALWCNYSDGEKDGKYFSNIFDRGSDEQYGTYREGMKEGEWIDYNQKHDFVVIENFKDGELQDESSA
jgi:antitoxin component YwqK of YwqJK toxin-antitoxin module